MAVAREGTVQSWPGWACSAARAGPATGSVSALSQDAARSGAGAVSSQARSSWTSRISTMRFSTAGPRLGQADFAGEQPESGVHGGAGLAGGDMQHVGQQGEQWHGGGPVLVV